MSDFSTRNYFAHGGNELVIGGKLTFLPGATVEGAEGLLDMPDTAPLPSVPPPVCEITSITFWQCFGRAVCWLRRRLVMRLDSYG